MSEADRVIKTLEMIRDKYCSFWDMAKINDVIEFIRKKEVEWDE